MRSSKTVILAAALQLLSLPTFAEALPNETATRLADLALECVDQEYPNKIAHVMDSDADAQPPRKLTPAFFGCLVWISEVHWYFLLSLV